MPGRRAARRAHRVGNRSPVRPWWYRALVVAAVVLLVVVTGVAVRAALRPAAPPPAPVVAPQTGALAAVRDGAAWRAFNSSPCGSGAATVPVERLAGGAWVAAATPLVRVDQLAFTSAAAGIAVGVNAQCQPAYAVTTDGGVSWRAGSPARPLESASSAGSTLWALDASGSGQPRLLHLSADGSSVLGSPRVVPCSQTDGPPSIVEGVDATYGLALCQGPSGEGRLLLRTTTAGQYWDRLTDARPSTGFDLLGRLQALSFPTRSHGFVLGASTDCAAGQVRASVDSGATWTALPCPTGLTQVLSMAFWSDTSGMLLGRVGDATTVLRTADGGRTWTPLS